MDKKAQLTLFIIAGVLIAVIVGVLIYSGTVQREAEKEPIISEGLEFPAELKPVGVFVQSCLEREGLKTINITAIQGGRPLAPRHPYGWNNMTLSHGYFLGLNEIPTLEEMQDEMAGYLKIHLNDCLNDLQTFRDRGMDLVLGEMSPKFEVGSDAVVIGLNFPVTLRKETGDVKAEEFSVTVPSRLGYLHGAAREIVDKDVKENADLYFVSLFETIAKITTIDPAEEVMFFSLEDTKNQSVFFNFVNTYKPNNAPLITAMPESTSLEIGESLVFDVNATDEDGDNLTFSDDTELFEISPTGSISFTADKEGYHNILITVSDGKGGIAQDSFAISVI